MRAEMYDATRAEAIAALNDAFRTSPPVSDWTLTRALVAKGPEFVVAALLAVQAFTAFTEDNDPYGEHDFGEVKIEGERVWFKIDVYDRQLEFGSPDPSDPAVSRRIMTIMLPEDY